MTQLRVILGWKGIKERENTGVGRVEFENIKKIIYFEFESLFYKQIHL